MNKFLLSAFILLAGGLCVLAQPRMGQRVISGRVMDINTKKPLENVNIVNMTTYKGTVTNSDGFFSIENSVGDSLYISIMGYGSTTIPVTTGMINREYLPIYLSPQTYNLDEVIVRQHYLTGLLEVDARSVSPMYYDYLVKVEGTKQTSEVRTTPRKATPFSPVEFVSSFFSKDKKLERLKKEDAVNEMLKKKYDREFLTQALGLTREELEELLLYCNQDPKWVIKASDLEILDALNKCKQDMEKKQAQESGE